MNGHRTGTVGLLLALLLWVSLLPVSALGAEIDPEPDTEPVQASEPEVALEETEAEQEESADVLREEESSQTPEEQTVQAPVETVTERAAFDGGNVAQVNGGTAFTTLEAAVAAAGRGDTVKLIEDVVLTQPVIVHKNLKLNLNGHTITGGETALEINEGISATITDDSQPGMTGTITATAPADKVACCIRNRGTLTLTGNVHLTIDSGNAVGCGVYNAGSFTKSGCVITVSAQNAYGIYNDKGILELQSGDIRTDGAEDGGGVYNNSGAVTLSGGWIYVPSGDGISNNGGSVTISGDAVIEAGRAGVCSFERSTLSVQGGTLSGQEMGLETENSAVAEISGGTVTSQADKGGSAVVLGGSSSVTLSGGTLSGDGRSVELQAAADGAALTFTVTGGNVANAIQKDGSGGTITLSGGSYGVKPEADWVAENCIVIESRTQPGYGWEITRGLVTAPRPLQLTYNGSPQQLVQRGINYPLTNCSVQYALGDEPFGDSIPTAVDAGTYTVRYRIVSDSFESRTMSVEATIARASLDRAIVTAPARAYTGSALHPDVTVTLGTRTLTPADFTVTSADPVNAGTYDLLISGAGNYQGTAKGKFIVNKANQNIVVNGPASVVKGKSAKFTFRNVSGAVTCTSGNPSVAKLSATSRKGTTVTGLKPGTATITLKAKGDANHNAATKQWKITVKLAAPALKSVSNGKGGVQLTFAPVNGAAKYRVMGKVENGQWKKLADTTKLTYVWKKAPHGKKVSLSVCCLDVNGVVRSDYNTKGKSIVYLKAPTLKNGAAGSVKVTWSKLSGVKGYEIQYSLSSNFAKAKKITVKSPSAVTKTVKHLTGGKTWYFRYRGCSQVNGKTAYTSWSAGVGISVSK